MNDHSSHHSKDVARRRRPAYPDKVVRPNGFQPGDWGAAEAATAVLTKAQGHMSPSCPYLGAASAAHGRPNKADYEGVNPADSWLVASPDRQQGQVLQVRWNVGGHHGHPFAQLIVCSVMKEQNDRELSGLSVT